MMTARYAGFLQRSLPPFWPTADRAMVLAALQAARRDRRAAAAGGRAGAARADRRRRRRRWATPTAVRMPRRRFPWSARSPRTRRRRSRRAPPSPTATRGPSRRTRSCATASSSGSPSTSSPSRWSCRSRPCGRLRLARARGSEVSAAAAPIPSPSTGLIGAVGGRVTAMSDEVAVQPPGAAVRPGLRARVAARRAGLAQTLDDLKVSEPELETIRLYAAAYTAGELTLHASPSLFGGAKCIVVHDLDEADDELQADLLAALAGEPEPDLTLVVLHKGGSRGKKVLDTLKGSGARVIDAPAIKTDRDKADFAAHEFRAGPGARPPARPCTRSSRPSARTSASCRRPASSSIDDTTGRHRRAGRADLPRGQGRGDRLPGGRRRHGRRHRGGAAPAAARHRRRGRPGADRGRARPAGRAS